MQNKIKIKEENVERENGIRPLEGS